MRRPILLLATLLSVAACGDAARSIGPVMGNVPHFAISDGANTSGGPANGDFFFLPPMVPDPSGALTYDVGAFDATLAPRVAICQLTTVEPRVCDGLPFRTFSGEEIAVSTTDEHYHVNWHTDEDAEHLDVVDQLYRIQVLLPRHSHDGTVDYRTLGFADVDPVASGNELKEMKNIATGQVIGLVDGRTLPIKFRIERSPRCGDSDDCVEAIVGDEGGRVETETGYAIAEFPDGWLPEGFEEVVVSIRRVAIGGGAGQETSCHGSTLAEFEGCYDFETDPEVGTFAQPAVISTCIEPAAGALEPFLQLAASDDGANFRLLPPRVVTIECEGFEGTEGSGGPVSFLGRIGERALAFGERIGVALAPRKLYAVDQGRGGSIDDFSHGGWVLPGRAVLFDPAESPVTFSPLSTRTIQVRVISDHDASEESTPVPLSNFTVNFSVSTAGGTLSAPSAVTNADGIATILWVLPEDGQHTLTAIAAGSDVPAILVANVLSQLPTTTTIGGTSLIRDGESPFLFAAVSGGSPGEGEDAQVSFYDGETLVETVPLNDEGKAFLTHTEWALRSHTITAVFEGTPTLASSTSEPVEVDVLRRLTALDGFLGSIGENFSTESFDATPTGTLVSTIIAGLLNISSPFDRIVVLGNGEGRAIFGFDEEGNPTRSAGEGRYELDFLLSRSAIAFDITAKNPATPPMFVEVHTASGTYVFEVQNSSALETDPIFFSVLASTPITRVVVVEGPEVGDSTISEETGLDEFYVGSAPLEP